MRNIWRVSMTVLSRSEITDTIEHFEAWAGNKQKRRKRLVRELTRAKKLAEAEPKTER